LVTKTGACTAPLDWPKAQNGSPAVAGTEAPSWIASASDEESAVENLIFLTNHCVVSQSSGA
jgi:hypothetical protein